jgi:hypothetical protein
MTDLQKQLALAQHVHEHARDHTVVMAAACLAELIRAHVPTATFATLRIQQGETCARYYDPELPEDAHREAQQYANLLDDDTWAMWEALSVEENRKDHKSLTCHEFNHNPPHGPRTLVLDLDAALAYLGRLHDPSGANCPRSCPLWREEGPGVPDLGPCHTCGAQAGENCTADCPYPVYTLGSSASLGAEPAALTVPWPGQH